MAKGLGKGMKIAYLADHPQYVSTVANWIMDEWGHESPVMTLEKMEARFREHLNRGAVPLTLLAMEADHPLGTASLVWHDMRDRQDLSPWLAAVYVLPEHQGKGVGAKLVKSIELLSANLEVEQLYLFTPDREAFYARLNWTVLERTRYREKDVVIMVKSMM
jgi:GNAT superfamily N-acetyltransferase